MMAAGDFWAWFEREVKDQMATDGPCDERTVRRYILRTWLLYSPVAGHA